DAPADTKKVDNSSTTKKPSGPPDKPTAGVDNGPGTSKPQDTSKDKDQEPAKSQSDKPGAAKNASDTASGKGATIGMCRGADYSLKFTSSSKLLFAVRLVKLVLKNGVVEVVYGNFKFPSSLGTSDAEKLTARIDPANPTVTGLERRDHQ